jgi:hypothetical protein
MTQSIYLSEFPVFYVLILCSQSIVSRILKVAIVAGVPYTPVL